YDDFFVSSDIERDFYKTVLSVKPYSVSYDVKEFENIVSVSKMLEDNNIKAESAAKEVSSLQNTFENLNKLFLIVSLLILTIGLFISVILLVKFQNSRYREIGLLSALGFCKNTIRTIIISENVLLSVAAAFFNAMFIGVTYLITSVFQMGLIITAPQIILSILGTGFAVIIISITVSYKLIHTEPAVALRM
ncbi:MAG: macrolide ABC transporter ATP-binding protein/permease, partial [Clostridiales bacterium]